MSADILERLEAAASAYPADVFGELTEADRRDYGNVIQRASASMGRHMAPLLTEAAAEIGRLRGEVEATAMLNLVDGWVLEVFRGIDGELGVWARNESNARVWIARTKGGQSE